MQLNTGKRLDSPEITLQSTLSVWTAVWPLGRESAPSEGSFLHISSSKKTFVWPDLLPGRAHLSPVTAGGALTPRLGWTANFQTG